MDENIVKFVMPKIVPISELFANDYNPNRMPKEEMRLLSDCISTFGFLFPLVVSYDKDKDEETNGNLKYRIIDGFHRFETLKKLKTKEALIVDLNIPFYQAVQLTVLMNRIKGLHQVERMSDLVIKLEDLGLSDDEISNNLGMEAEEYIRLKQQLGLAHSFKNVQYSNSWTIEKK